MTKSAGDLLSCGDRIGQIPSTYQREVPGTSSAPNLNCTPGIQGVDKPIFGKVAWGRQVVWSTLPGRFGIGFCHLDRSDRGQLKLIYALAGGGAKTTPRSPKIWSSCATGGGPTGIGGSVKVAAGSDRARKPRSKPAGVMRITALAWGVRRVNPCSTCLGKYTKSPGSGRHILIADQEIDFPLQKVIALTSRLWVCGGGSNP